MSIISCNCRGLGNPSAVPFIRDLVCKYKLDILFLCETLVHANKIEEVRVRLGFEEAFVVIRLGEAVGWRVC
jgi:hypothetical protein